MKVLVACEFSGVVRDAFINRGHDAMSCDLLPTDKPGPHHQGDVFDIIGNGWDLMIAHPPCTHLASSGARHFAAKRADGRQQQGIDFFLALVNAPVPCVCIENPVGIMSSVFRKPDQIIQPYNFGDDASKQTCLWLIGLQPLVSTKFIPPRYVCVCGLVFSYELGKYGCPDACGGVAKPRWANQTNSGQNKLGPSADRWKLRSITYQGIADAMAEQWGHNQYLEVK